jgi:hypothetical protein
MTEQQGSNSGQDGPGPYRGVFGSSGSSPGPQPPTPYGDPPSAYGNAPGAYGGLYGASRYSQPVAPPKQVTIAAIISLGLGAMCLLLAALTLTSAGEQISEVLTGSKGNESTAVVAALVCAVVYVIPAIYLRKRRPWARYMLIGVAAIGIAGGVMALPTSILGLAIHGALLLLMLQQPTKLWFHHR